MSPDSPAPDAMDEFAIFLRKFTGNPLISRYWLKAFLFTAFSITVSVAGQQPVLELARVYPKSIRGYKVERARVVVSRNAAQSVSDSTAGQSPDAVVKLGSPSIVSISPLGITFELPITMTGLIQGGHVDFLSFQDIVVNGTSVSVDDYKTEFELSTDREFNLPTPIRVYVTPPRAVLGALDEWNDSKAVWNVSGTVFVFGRFKKFLMKFKRAIPVEVQAEIRNPLHSGA